ncbi:sensor histidine kinase [Kutzneria sp. NPDC051319]|uniref:sensor histidine kinase n=1 Tax=Kutzneria sp. NPDC051319 TaxID=3155047 RepID=UPI00342DD80B
MSSTGTQHADPFVHPALFYRGDDEYLVGGVPFITEGLAAGEPVAVAAPAAKLALLRDALGSAAGQVRMLDMTEVGRNPGRIIPGVLRAFADAHPDRHVRIIGEPIWPQRSDHEYPACVQHEALINHAFTGRDVTILCPYDAERLDPVVLADAARTHPLLVDAAGQHHSEAYAPDEAIAAYNRDLAAPVDATTVAVDSRGLAGLRQMAAEFAARVGLSAQRRDDLLLVLTELATNSIEHARSIATVLLGIDGHHLVCQVRDTGRLSDPLVGRRPEVAGQLRGRGLLMVNQLADLVRIHTSAQGTTIVARFTLARTF